MSDLNYLEKKLHFLQKGEANMIEFYHLSVKYNLIKSDLESDHSEKFALITSHAESYDLLVDEALLNGDNLFKFNQFFAQEIKSIEISTQSSGMPLDQFDKLMDFLLKVIEVKRDLEKSIELLSGNLRGLKEKRENLEKILINVSNVQRPKSKEIEQPKTEIKEKNTKINGIMITALLLALF